MTTIHLIRNSRPGMPSVGLAIFFVFLLAACPQENRIRPPEGFSGKVTTLVTTSVRGTLRGDAEGQSLLKTALPSLSQKETYDEVLAALRVQERLSHLAEPINADVMFELRKPEHREVRDNFDTPAVQREIVSAVTAGMRQALGQLDGEGGDGN